MTALSVNKKLVGRFRFDYEYEYDYEIRRFWRQMPIARVISCLRDKVVVIAHLRTSFEENVVLEWAMTTTLSRQHEMTRAIGAQNGESRSRTRSQI